MATATYSEFAETAVDLREATEAWGSAQDDASLMAAREAWATASAVWQHAELFQVGPAASASSSPDFGEDFRDQIYSWPLVNACRVDQELVEGSYTDVDAFASEQVNVKGLDALERLLFHPGDTNACSIKSSINTDGSWDALSSEERVQKRAAYAVTVATLLERDATALADRWSTSFGEELSTPGSPTSRFTTVQEALNAVSDALFYLDKMTKDAKLGTPLGLINCESETCPEAVESPLGLQSTRWIRENLNGLRRVLMGGKEPAMEGQTGWVDLLASLGGVGPGE